MMELKKQSLHTYFLKVNGKYVGKAVRAR